MIFFRDELKEITQKHLSDLEYALAELEIVKLLMQETGVAKKIPQDLKGYVDNKNLMEAQCIHIQRLLTELENITPTKRLEISEKVRDV